MKTEEKITFLQTIFAAKGKKTLAQDGEPLPEELLTQAEKDAVDDPQILAEVVIEEISIDGMCGVY